jgi:hypothetical protein
MPPSHVNFRTRSKYRPEWGVDDALREILQNTFDGAAEYAKKEFQKGRKHLRGLEWIVRKKKPSKCIQEKTGYEFGYTGTIILTIGEKDQ